MLAASIKIQHYKITILYVNVDFRNSTMFILVVRFQQQFFFSFSGTTRLAGGR
jgi:hypothetical protein